MRLEPDTGLWWLSRPLWILVLALVLAPFLAGFARFEALARGDTNEPPPAWRAIVGSATMCWGIAALALGGIGSDGWLGARIGMVGLIVAGASLAMVGAHRRSPLGQHDP